MALQARAWDRLTVKDAAQYCGLSERAFRAHMRAGNPVPIVPGGRGRGHPALFDYPTLNEFLGRPKRVGRPRGGLDADHPDRVEAAIDEMAKDITQSWDNRSKRYLLGQAIDKDVLQTSALRTFPSDPTEYWRHIVTALFLAGRGGTFGTAWPVLLVAIQRLHVAGVSIDSSASALECDRSSIRLYLDRWDQLRNPPETAPRSSGIERPVPLNQQEVTAITSHGPNPHLLVHLPTNGKWGWMTIKKMKEKDPEAVKSSGRRNRTLSGIEWQHIRYHEVAPFDDNLLAAEEI
jgi:hypothetical protein